MKRAVLLWCALAVAMVGACSKDDGASKSDAPAAVPAAATAAKGSPELLGLLPARNEVSGWDVSKAARSFTADNLYELIDGAADSFVTYGVQEVVTSEYTQAASGYQAVIEIYRMKDALNAFGKYAEERNADYQFVPVGNEGYSGGTSLNFWSGPYYVKLTAFQDKDAIRQELAKLAQSVASKVKEPGAAPQEFALFPPDHQVAHSTLYIPKDVLAQGYFADGYQASYKASGKESKLVLIRFETDAAAREGLARYKEAVAKAGKDVKPISSPGDGGFAGTDRFYGNLAAVRSGKHLVVALGTPTPDAGKKQVAEVVGKMKKR